MALDHKEILERFHHDWDADRDNRDDAVEDLHFMAGDQWSDDDRAQRERAGRPTITVNRMGAFVRQVSGSLRQSQPSIDPFPVDSKTDENLTEIFGGLIRQIEYRSNAGAAYAHGIEMSVGCGIGHWRVNTKFIDDTVFDQEICIERIIDPLSVIWDGGAVKLDRSDAKHCFVTELMPMQAFRAKYTNATHSDFPSGTSARSNLYWGAVDTVRVAEYWRLEPVKKTLGLTNTGETIDLTNISPQNYEILGIERTREADSFKVMHQMISGSDFLSDEVEWAGRHIPIIPIIGNEVPIDGRVVRHGLIRAAKDPQRLYNYWRSAAAEIIAASPKSPYIATTNMIKGLENFWNNANTSTLPYLPFKVDPDAPNMRPMREQPPTAPAAMWQEAAVAQDDMKATTSLFDASLGAQGNEVSGVAIEARQRQGDTGAFVYFDNFNRAIKRTGEILVDLIPRIYDTDRVVRIVGKDDQESFAEINREVMDQNGERVLVNDLSAGRFDVRIKTGPSYTTARIEAREHLSRMVQSNPGLWNIVGDLIVENMDFPGASQIAARLRKTMDPAIVADQSDAPPAPPDPMVEAMRRLEMVSAKLKVEQQNAEVEKTEAETDKIEAETFGKMKELERKDLETELKAIETLMKKAGRDRAPEFSA